MGEFTETLPLFWECVFYRIFLAYQTGSRLKKGIEQFLALMYTVMVEIHNILPEHLCIFPILRGTLMHCNSHEIHGCSEICLTEPLLPTFYSSTLLKLYIKVPSFDKYLYILDGRFNQLQTFCIDLNNIYPSYDIEDQVNFTRKVFSCQSEN